MQRLTTGRLAQETGVNLETVRFYERRGLLPKPPRSASGYRLYPAESVRRLRFVHRAKELGFSLAEIKELLCLRLSPRTSAVAVRKRAEAKIGEIETRIKTFTNSIVSLQVAHPALNTSMRFFAAMPAYKPIPLTQDSCESQACVDHNADESPENGCEGIHVP